MNKLADDLQLPIPRLSPKLAKVADVERFVQKLEPRCQQGCLPARLRAAVTQWRDNGGVLTRDILPADHGSVPMVEACLLRHKVLEGGYILKSRAFMLTFNKRTWTRNA